MGNIRGKHGKKNQKHARHVCWCFQIKCLSAGSLAAGILNLPQNKQKNIDQEKLDEHFFNAMTDYEVVSVKDQRSKQKKKKKTECKLFP